MDGAVSVVLPNCTEFVEIRFEWRDVIGLIRGEAKLITLGSGRDDQRVRSTVISTERHIVLNTDSTKSSTCDFAHNKLQPNIGD